MAGFWSERLGVAPSQPAPAPAPAPASTTPWWMPQPAPQQPQSAPQQPQAPAPQQPVQQQPSSVPPDGESHFGDLLHQDGYTTEKAQSARDSESCPECGSGNYMAAKGHPNSMKQCFNCGYNPRFAHSTAGAASTGQKNVAPPRPARVQLLAEGNFNPGQIVGRVG